MIFIEIKTDKEGGYTLVAKERDSQWPPIHLAYRRSPEQILTLVRTILGEDTAGQSGSANGSNPGAVDRG